MITRAWHFTLMTGTIIVVWWHHKKVFRKGNYRFRKFFADTMTVFREAQKSIQQKEFAGMPKELASA
jgi:hypothetical protein